MAPLDRRAKRATKVIKVTRGIRVYKVFKGQSVPKVRLGRLALKGQRVIPVHRVRRGCVAKMVYPVIGNGLAPVCVSTVHPDGVAM